MKYVNISIEQIKNNVDNLIGKPILMSVNRGRKHFEKFTAEVVATYPRIFTVKISEPTIQPTQSFSYTEILCGNVIINKNFENISQV